MAEMAGTVEAIKTVEIAEREKKIPKKWTPKEIKQFRKENRITRRALGEMLGGLTMTCVYYWERGWRNPNKSAKELLTKLAEKGVPKKMISRKENKILAPALRLLKLEGCWKGKLPL